jgi:hypothetical protein
MIVSVGPSRLRMTSETSWFVDQLRPKSKVKTCCTKIQSCTHQGWSMPSWRRMFSICAGSGTFPARISAGSPPTQLNSTKTSAMTPARVGTICQSRLARYAPMSGPA